MGKDMAKSSGSKGLKVSHVAKVLIENAFLNHRDMQSHSFENFVDRLENFPSGTSPMLYLPGMAIRVIVRSNHIIPLAQIHGEEELYPPSMGAVRDMLADGKIVLTENQLMMEESTLPRVRLLAYLEKIEANPKQVRLGEICSLHPEIDHLPINWAASSKENHYSVSTGAHELVSYRFDFASISTPWARTRKHIEAHYAKDSPKLKLARPKGSLA